MTDEWFKGLSEFETLSLQYYRAIIHADNLNLECGYGVLNDGNDIETFHRQAKEACSERDAIKKKILDLATKVGGDIR